MSKSLQYLMLTSIKGSIRNTIKKPLKTIGIVLGTIYFVSIPFLMKDLAISMGLDNNVGFIIIATISTVYLRLPATLSYFKRKGVIFKKADINFILAAPTKPKQALIYALLKQTYMSVVMQIMIFVAAMYIFNLSFWLTSLYVGVNFIFSSLVAYSLALLMYASENITHSQKQGIRNTVYLILIIFSLSLIYEVASKTLAFGFDLTYILSVFSHPLALLIPIFGWQLGWLNLVILGPSLINIISTTLFFLSAIILTYLAYKMESSGGYYEDALSYSEDLALIESKKSNVTFSQSLGLKQKHIDYKGRLSGVGAKVIFSKQLIERRRVRKYFLSFGDLVYLIAGIGIGLLGVFTNDFVNPDYFFQIMCGITIYLGVFFNPQPTWKNDFQNYFIFIIPQSFSKKLLYATLLEHLITFIRALLLTIPAGLMLKASFLNIIFAIIAQTSIKAMITYLSIFIEEVLGSRIGKVLASFINIFTSIFALIVVILILAFSGFLGNFVSLGLIVIYSMLLMLGFLFLSAKFLSNMESLDS